MIGTKIKGFRHLIRMAKTLQEVTFFFKHDNLAIGGGVALYVDGEKIRNPFMITSGDYLLLFNDCYNNCKNIDNLNYFENTEIGNKVKELFNKYYHIWVVPINKKNFKDDYMYMREIVVMPKDFEKMYDDFCNANKKQIPNITKYASVDCALFKYIFAISSGSKNFFFWAVNAYFKNRITIFQIESILRWNDKYNQLQSKLKKGTITAYTSQSDFFYIVREMALLRRTKRANDVINSFNTAQKKLLKGVSLTDRDYDTLSKFGRLSEKKKNNFIRKMSTVEDPAEILRQMSFLADIHFEWNKKSFLDYYNNLENFNCEIVMEKGDMILLKVKDYEAVKRLAKATNWCISKDKKYWNEYVEMNPDATQYVLFDFSKKEDDNLSIVGFTSVHDRGITHAHDFQNRNIMSGRRSAVSEIKSFVSKYINSGNIYGVLDKYGINLSDVVSYEPSHYEWKRDSMFDYLNKCIDDEEYYIIHDDGNKLVIIAEDDNIKYFIGDAYIDNRNHGYQDGDQYIIFIDFTKKQNDPEKLIFGIIHHNFLTEESTCDRLYNDRFEVITQTFDSKLEEFGLPYDTICRTENVVDRFYTAYTGLQFSIVKDLIGNKAVRDDIKKHEKVSFLRDTLINVTFNYSSADYLKVIYDNGYTLYDFLGESFTADFGRRLFNAMCEHRNCHDVPSPKDIDNLRNETIDNYDYAMYVGYFSMLMMFIENETNGLVFLPLINSIIERRKKASLYDLIISRICEKIDFNKNSNTLKLILHYVNANNSSCVYNAIMSKKVNSQTASLISSILNGGSNIHKTTEIWVKQDGGVYTLQNINEEAIAHAPRRR